jgi:Tfp pilus assembly protein PilE
MGQQQLLLIVLGVIIVGIAIVVGINLFNAHSVSANRDAVASDLNNLGALARQYYNKPHAMGGGSNSFTGWDITTTGLSSTANGSYTATVTDQLVTIAGTGIQVGNDGSTNIRETNYTTPVGDSVVVVN